ncbi:hypothetical protein HPB51_010828 [Rhipicephalus microplus]|uniref:THAP-type domain-containing protein n=1 Tax=Rhipicephalus microplus TaxID=6941 RepID=A0A9J6E0T5_RHIMP|nr:hypothetical protein HPB51_010828 [Rhipicephalus microplus]
MTRTLWQATRRGEICNSQTTTGKTNVTTIASVVKLGGAAQNRRLSVRLVAVQSHRASPLPCRRPRRQAAPAPNRRSVRSLARGFPLLQPSSHTSRRAVFPTSMPTCYVPGCTSGYRNDANKSERHFFSGPSDATLLSAWNKVIPRADRELAEKSKVCDLHFYDQDIQKCYVHTINEETVKVPRGKWTLVEGAVPKVFPNLPSYLSKPPDKKRKRRERSTGQTVSPSVSPSDGVQGEDAQETQTAWSADFEEVTLSDLESVQLPSLWRMLTLEDSDGKYMVCFTLTAQRRLPQIEKCVVVGTDNIATASALGRVVTALKNVSIRTLGDLANLIDRVDKLNVCHGVERVKAVSYTRKCKVLSSEARSKPCHKGIKEQQVQMLQKQKRASQRQKKVKNLHKKAIRAASARVSFMVEVADLRKQLQSQKSVAIEKTLSSLPPIQRLAFQTSLQQVKAKSPRGVRYTKVWVMNCLLLRIASPRAYNLLRTTKLLPLPTTSRLNQILSGVPCEYGFNEVALESI